MKKIYVVFHMLKGHDIFLIIQEIGQFDQNLNVRLYNLGKYMDFKRGMNLNFTVSMEFM